MMPKEAGSLEVKDLTMHYGTLRGPVRAVEDVSFNLGRGEALGLVGESGCGKSSTMLTILRLLPRNAEVKKGEIFFEGTDLLKMGEGDFRKKIRWKKISTVFQGSMNAMHPMMKVGDQIAEAVMLHEKAKKREALEQAKKLLELTGIEGSRINRYPHELSGGMKQRAVIAMSLACNPDLVIADEPTTALDVIIAAQVMNLMKELQKKLNLSLIIVTHDLSIASEVCNKIAIMYAGKIVEEGGTQQVFHETMHPYSRGLIAAFPSILGPKTKLKPISGFPPDLLEPPSGCRFHPRCPYAMEICQKKEPPLTDVGMEHLVACHLY